jgi:MarR family transcriptional regulator for hemolysin
MKLIGRTTRCAAIYREEEFKKLGLTSTQHAFILHICKHPGILQHELPKLLLLDKSNVTRQLSALEDSGFAIRKPSEHNRKHICIFPTPKAYDTYPKIKAVLSKWTQLITENFDEHELITLHTLMNKLYENALATTLENEGYI